MSYCKHNAKQFACLFTVSCQNRRNIELLAFATAAPRIARDQGVTRDAVNKWSKLHADFPGPVQTSAVGRLYDLAAVRKWAAKKGLPKRRGI